MHELLTILYLVSTFILLCENANLRKHLNMANEDIAKLLAQNYDIRIECIKKNKIKSEE